MKTVFQLVSGMIASDDAAGNLLSGIARGLCGEIIPIGVNHNRAVEDIPDLKAFVIEDFPGIALVA